MSIRVTCGSCGKRLKAPDGSDNRSFLCPRCKTRNVIPPLPTLAPEPVFATPRQSKSEPVEDTSRLSSQSYPRSVIIVISACAAAALLVGASYLGFCFFVGSGSKDRAPRQDGFLTSFEALGEYCEESIAAIKSETKANPIRGDELKADRLAKLQSALVGKTVRWELRITEITGNSITLEAYHGRSYEIMLRGLDGIPSPTPQYDIYVLCKFDYRPNASLVGLPRETIRRLSKGGTVTITGRVDDVEFTESSYYLINVNDTRLAE